MEELEATSHDVCTRACAQNYEQMRLPSIHRSISFVFGLSLIAVTFMKCELTFLHTVNASVRGVKKEVVHERKMHTSTHMGTHVTLEILGSPFQILNSTASVRRALFAGVHAGNLTVIADSFQTFPVQGLSGIILIRYEQVDDDVKA